MKKLTPSIIILFLLIIGVNEINGQTIREVKKKINYRSMTHVKDKEQIGLGIAGLQNGFAVNGLYGYYLKKNIFIRGDFFYENVRIDYSKLNLFYLSPELNYTVKKVSYWLFVNVKGGLIIGNEMMTNSIMVNRKLNNLVFGEKVGIKVECFVTPVFSINLDIEQRIFNHSMVGSLSEQAYLSFSFNY